MQIWVLTNEYERNIIGGLGIVATHLTQAFARDEELEVTLFAKSASSKVQVENSKGVALLRFPRNSKFHSVAKQVFDPLEIVRWLTKNGYSKPDLIHIHSVQWARLAYYFKKYLDVPVVYTCHSLVILEAKSVLRAEVSRRQEKLLRVVDHVVVPSQWQHDKLIEVYPFCADKTTIIENGVEVREGGSHAALSRLLFVGRLVNSKGIEELLGAVAMLAKKSSVVRLDVVGAGTGQYFNKLQRLSQSLGIAKRVRWLGFLPPEQVLRLYPSYGVVIVPSRQESFGLVALEALANGVPLVSTVSGGLSDFVNSEVAEVIPEVESGAIANAIRNVWSERTRTERRVAAGLLAASTFGWQKTATRSLDLFKQVMTTKGVSPVPRRRWKLLDTWKAKRQGSVWIVEDQFATRGYFKFTTEDQWYYAGPMIANEYIAAALAERVGLPVGELEQASIAGADGIVQKGIVSVEVPAFEMRTWAQASDEVRQEPERHVKDIDLLAQTVVFDAWICNVDRAAGKNLILYRNNTEKKYDWYLIDHGLTLYGSPRKWKRGAWNSPFWEQLWRFYNVPKGLLRLQSNQKVLLPMIEKIEALQPSDIDDALRKVPRGHLKDKERQFIRTLLLHRQKLLRSIIERWLAFEGTKEYEG
ncbi:MAG: HipA family kinase [Tumebacillaceae bacterium]